ncbi:protein-tyrosine-phosphatase [Streptomyces sp. YC537]|uniref:Protein-tyrosine-phosphatase n=1 Tax=Streptomyces boluensis TaxID=1775135 RepID=A0A964XQA8_9ACTN|nr:protein-tyrosine-phosphatase [Streptomyces boluensis]
MRTLRTRRATAAALAAALLGTLPACATTDAPAGKATPPAAGSAADDGARPGAPIALDGAVNVRDLGGYRTDKGRHIRPGQAFRADSLGKATKADVKKLSALNLGTVVDFRTPLEVKRDGADRLPAGLKVTSRAVNDLGLYAKTMEAIGSKDPVKQEDMLGGGKAEQLMRDIYRSFATDPDSRRQFAATLRDLAKDRRTPLVFHCTSGKDRTGWVSYLLLRAVGVPARTAEKDYLLSNDFRAKADRETREGLEKSGYMKNPDLLVPLQDVRADYLDAALDQVRRDYGGLDGYLTEGLGLDRSNLAGLRARLVR